MVDTGHQLKNPSLLCKTIKLSKVIKSFTEGIQKTLIADSSNILIEKEHNWN